MKRAILFDFHNTLATCDSWLQLEIRHLPGQALRRLSGRGVLGEIAPGQVERAEALFRKLRQEVRESGVELSALEGTSRVLSLMGYDLSGPHLERVVVELEEECLEELLPIPGAREAVWALRHAGYKLGIVSSAGYPPFVEAALEQLGLRAAFQVVVTSAGEGLYKSDPEIFRRAAERLGARPEEAIHVGDHAIYDIRTAQAAGLSAIWFKGEARRTAHLHGTPWEETLRAGKNADAIVESMSEVFDAALALASGE